MPREAVARSARRATSATEIVYALSSTGCDIRYVRGAHGIQVVDASARRLLARRAAEGAAHARLAIARPETAAHLLGWYTDTTPREFVARRALLRLSIPAQAL